MKTTRNIVIAVDGHSSCGKSTVAKEVAKAIGIAYIDTGAMYRAVTLAALRRGLISPDGPDSEAIAALLPSIEISFDFDQAQGRNTTYLNGENVEDEIRSMPVSQSVSAVSAIAAVRQKLTEWQRQMGQRQSVIMDGRDIGTAVFPNADLKIFMTARPEVRARRRFDEMTAKGQEPVFEQVLANVVERDRQDSTRALNPLRKADDAVELDNSDISRQEQYDFILNLLAQRGLIEK
ncbi:MAG: (d)CMP kinase [Bacteroidales bacterium]|nr:(d)CMP kinase [Bacteroidales bacterium]